MKKLPNGLLSLSPTDLVTFGTCRHASRLDYDLATGRGAARYARDPNADVLAELGDRHERAYIRHLRGQGREVLEIGGLADDTEHVDRTKAAMEEGVEIIVQAPLASGAWRGIADILVRCEGASRLGPFHYEVQDTKLARAAKVGTLLQLSLYSAWLAEIQGVAPEHFHVVTPGDPFAIESFRTDDYAAYTRRMQRRHEQFLEELELEIADTKPEPIDHCMLCRWWRDCDARWRRDDHLSLVANLGRNHRRELETHGVTRVNDLAALSAPLPFRPDYGSADAYLASAHQAQLQVRSRETGEVQYELLALDEGTGLAQLPEPHPQDLFLDLEGDPFFGLGGLEYLWGWAHPDSAYVHRWAFDPLSEKRAFEAFVDLASRLRQEHPAMHIYHYGAYETGALKRLAGHHATREEELDALLRANVFVDLMAVTKRAARIGAEAYSLKDLERIHGYVRDADLRAVGPHKRSVEHALMLGTQEEVPVESLDMVRLYNRDDVRSTEALRVWLEGERARLVRAGADLPRPTLGEGEVSEERQERRREAEEVIEALQAHLPEDPSDWAEKHQAYALLAAMINFEHREDNVGWWEFFALAEATPDELETSKSAVAHLVFVEAAGGTERSPVYRFRYPPQDIDVRGGEEFYVASPDAATCVAKVEAHDALARTLDLKMRGSHRSLRPQHGFFRNRIPPNRAPDLRLAFARDVLARGLEAPPPFRAARDLLLRRIGRDSKGRLGARRLSGETTVQAAIRLAEALDGGVLPIQGPPGAGKSYTAARMIVELARQGKRVGVTAVSNKVIGNLLGGVAAAAREAGVSLRIVQKTSGDTPEGVEACSDNRRVEQRAQAGQIDVLGGTAWLWTRERMANWADHLVVDEAGQMCLAVALSEATVVDNLILLGDPQQLDQPIQAAHPHGADVSALRHLIGERPTLAEGQGLFLDRTYRLAPRVCAFTSEAFYERKLQPAEHNDRIEVRGTDGFDGAGYAFHPVEHEGRAGWCPEEAQAVHDLVRRLTVHGASYRHRDGTERQITYRDILVVAPFNRQVREIERHLPDAVRVGTVDRFQGQEAPIVLYSMGVSQADLAPRGLDFLFSGNRLNVASSRAQARAILVATDPLFDALCKTAEDMRLINAHVRLVEFASEAQVLA